MMESVYFCLLLLLTSFPLSPTHAECSSHVVLHLISGTHHVFTFPAFIHAVLCDRKLLLLFAIYMVYTSPLRPC